METEKKSIRGTLTIIITASILTATIVIAVCAIFIPTENGVRQPNFDYVGSSLLPLWGTWIGTVLAFYFGKSNFDAAAKSYDKMIDKLSSEDKLASIPVMGAMIPMKQIVHLDYEQAKKNTLKEILENSDFQKYERYAFIDEKDILKYIIHKSAFTKYITDSVIAGNAKAHETTLEEFIATGIKDPKTPWLNGAGFVSMDCNLLDARKEMNSKENIKDVFVTRSGKNDEPIMGLITNNTLVEKLK
jgi:hypothetical protein